MPKKPTPTIDTWQADTWCRRLGYVDAYGRAMYRHLTGPHVSWRGFYMRVRLAMRGAVADSLPAGAPISALCDAPGVTRPHALPERVHYVNTHPASDFVRRARRHGLSFPSLGVYHR
jgi:hypothetical protein